MQITLGWDYWNKKRHDLRRDMLQLHYYLLLEAEMTVQHLLPPPVMRRFNMPDANVLSQAGVMGMCFSDARAGFLRGCLSCGDMGGATGCTGTAEGCALYTSLPEAQVH